MDFTGLGLFVTLGSQTPTQKSRMVHFLLLLGLFVVLPLGEAAAQIDPGFTWVNPQPTGDDILDVERVADGVFVAVTPNGLILRSDDAGVTWTFSHTRILENLWSVDAADGVVVVGAEGGVLHVSTDQGLNWDAIEIPELSQNLRGVAVINRNHWVAVGSTLSNDGVVLLTRDGGETWTFVDPGVPVAFRSVCFIDSLHGCASGTPGTVVSTTDGGDTWQVNQSPLLYGASLNVVSFGSGENGIAAGDYGRLFVTGDGGETWESHEYGSSTIFSDAAWLDDTTVVLVGKSRQIRSTDAGKTWNEILAGSYPLGMGFGSNSVEGMVSGVGGELLYTEDGGQRWVRRSSGAAGRNIYDLAIHESGVGYAVGYQGAVIRTEDSGASWWWTERFTPYVTGHLTRVAVPTANTVVVVAEDGAIYHSSDRGDRWSSNRVSEGRPLRDLSFSDSLNGWVVGHGVLYLSTDGGRSWQGDFTSITTPLYGVHALTPSLVYATGDGGHLFRTEDGGETWEDLQNEFTVRFSAVHADLQGNITLGWLGGLVHSSDGGVTWSDHPAPSGSSLRHFSFLTPNVVWCGQDDGPLMTTTDAGKTWEPREHGLRTGPLGNAAMSVVELIEPGYGYVAGASGFILEYRDPEESDVQEAGRQESHDGLIVRHVDDHVLIAGGSGVSDLLVYDVLGRLLYRVRVEDIQVGSVWIDINAVASGVLFVVEVESGRRGRGVVTQ